MPKVLARAVKITRAKRWSRGSNLPEGNEAADLVHESVRLIIEGERAWPPGLDLEVLLVGSVRSLASHLAKSPANRHDDFSPEVAEAQAASEPDRVPDPSPEDLLLQKRACKDLVAEAFSAAADDPVLNKIIEAAMEGHVRAEDIAHVKGLSPQQVYEGNRRLRRRIEAAARRRRP